MREAVIDRLYVEFGEPAGETPTAFCWNLGPGLDMVAEKDSPPHQGVVWVPWHDWGSGPPFSEFYDGATDRHPGTYNPACPSLAKGLSALRMALRVQGDLDAAVDLIRGLARSTGPPPPGSGPRG